MEPASLNTKWEPYLQRLKHTNNPIEVFNVLSKIDRKIDSLADEILNSPPTLTMLQQSLEGISSIALIDPRIKTLCLSIINSLNTRKPNLITLPKQLSQIASLKSASTESRQLVLDLKSLLSNSSDNPENIRSFNQILAKGLVLITESEYRHIFLKDVATVLEKMETWNCFEDERYLETLNLVNFVISHTDLKIPFYLVERLLDKNSNDVLWRYALYNASLDHLISFKMMKRDIATIHSILEADPVCKLAFINSLCVLLKDLTQRLPHSKRNYLNLLNFYAFLKERKAKIEILEMESLLYEVIPVQFTRGPVFLRKYQMELLTKSVQFDEQKHTSLSRKQFRLMIKHCYHIYQEDIHSIPLNDAVSLLEILKFFADKVLQKEMEKRIVDCLESLPKNNFGLLTKESFTVYSETLVKLAKLNLLSETNFYMGLWPPIPKRGSDLEKGMLFNEQDTELFAMYMRQLGLLHWLLSNFMPEKRANAEFTVLSVVNSYIEYQIYDVFWASSASKIDIKKTENLLQRVLSGMKNPYQFALAFELRAKLKPINPPPNQPQKSVDTIRLDATNYSHLEMCTFLPLIRDLPIGEFILSNDYSDSHFKAILIKKNFPDANIIYKEVSNGSNQS